MHLPMQSKEVRDCEAADTDSDGEEEETIFRFDESLRRRLSGEPPES